MAMTLPRRLERLDRRVVLATSASRTEPSVSLATASDVLTLLELATTAALSDLEAPPTERARTLGYLAGVALKALEVRGLEARVEALERVLHRRREDERERQ
jgi:hypothetical protein